MAKLQAKIITRTIVMLHECLLKKININPSNKVPMAIGITFLFDIITRPTWKHQNLHLRFVQLTNNNNIFIFSDIGGNTTYTTSSYFMMGSEATAIIIGKWLNQKLCLIFTNLEPCPFTIITSIRGTK